MAVLAGNEPGFIELLLGCLHVGAVFVPLNTRLTVPELQFQIEHCDPRLTVAGEGFDATLADAAPTRRRVALSELVGEPLDPVGADMDGAAPAMIVYTSGTTGRPKGATHTRSSLDAVIWQGVVAHEFTSADRGLEFLPLFHVGGLNLQTLPILSVGGTVLLHRGFDSDAVFDAIEHDGPTVSIIVPTPMQVLIDHPRWTELDPGALRGVMTGSSIVPADLLDAFNAAGLRAGQVYGSTETGPTSIGPRRRGADRDRSRRSALGADPGGGGGRRRRAGADHRVDPRARWRPPRPVQAADPARTGRGVAAHRAWQGPQERAGRSVQSLTRSLR